MKPHLGSAPRNRTRAEDVPRFFGEPVPRERPPAATQPQPRAARPAGVCAFAIGRPGDDCRRCGATWGAHFGGET